MTTRAYPLDAGCMDCGHGPSRWVVFWLNGLKYRVCKKHAAEYRNTTLKGINPRTGGPRVPRLQPGGDDA